MDGRVVWLLLGFEGDGEDGENPRARRPLRVTAPSVPLGVREREEDAPWRRMLSKDALGSTSQPGLGTNSPLCPWSRRNLDIPPGSLGMRPLRPPQPQLLSQPKANKQTQLLATKLFPINPPLPAALRKKLFFFSIDWWWLETTPCPRAWDVCPWLHGSCSNRERADTKSPFIEAEPFQPVPHWFFPLFFTFMAKNLI